MLISTHKDTVTVRRLAALDGQAGTTWKEVLDAHGGPLPLRCRFEESGRRFVNAEKQQVQGDATIWYRVDPELELKLDDVVVTKDKRAWRVARISIKKGLGVGRKYGEADLQKTELQVLEDKPSGE